MGQRTGGFRRADRLRCSWEFRRVGEQGRRAASERFVLMLAVRPGNGGPRRLGVTVSRRVGGAVTRNRVKRAVREWFRYERDRLPEGHDVLVIARRPAADLGAPGISLALDALAAELGGRENAR